MAIGYLYIINYIKMTKVYSKSRLWQFNYYTDIYMNKIKNSTYYRITYYLIENTIQNSIISFNRFRFISNKYD